MNGPFSNRLSFFSALTATLASCASPRPEVRPAEEPWASIGDVVVVAGAEDIEPVLRQYVQIDGTILLPSLGAVRVAGLTASEIDAILTQRYREYEDEIELEVRLECWLKPLAIVYGTTHGRCLALGACGRGCAHLVPLRELSELGWPYQVYVREHQAIGSDSQGCEEDRGH